MRKIFENLRTTNPIKRPRSVDAGFTTIIRGVIFLMELSQ